MKFAQMAVDWARVAAAHGRLSEQGQRFLDRMGG